MVDLHAPYSTANAISIPSLGAQLYLLDDGIGPTASAVRNTLTTPYTSQEHVTQVESGVSGPGSYLPCPGERCKPISPMRAC